MLNLTGIILKLSISPSGKIVLYFSVVVVVVFFTKQQYFEYMKRKFICFKHWGEVYIHNIHKIKLNEVKWPFSTKTKAGAVGIKNFLQKAR